MKPTVAVAVSGGVDSLMAAHLLKEHGHPVVGFHFLTGYESGQRNIESIAHQLDIPLHICDLSEAFEDRVVQYFLQTYQAGKTPNPCLQCNPIIKFGLLLDQTQQLGIDRLATGHYARIARDDRDPHSIRLLRGSDQRKDQSYFLAFLSRRQLSRALFPLGDYEKETIKKLAADKGLIPADQGREPGCMLYHRKHLCSFSYPTYRLRIQSWRYYRPKRPLIRAARGTTPLYCRPETRYQLPGR